MDYKAKGDELIVKFNGMMTDKDATQCAIIAVEEILKEQTMYGSVRDGRYQFWNETLNYLKSKQ